jgi:hypothetical protein
MKAGSVPITAVEERSMNELLEIVRALPLGGISFGGLVSVAIVLIFRGDIVPRSTVEAMRQDRDITIARYEAENAMLKEAYLLSEKARVAGADSDKELLILGRTTVHLLESIHERANGVNDDLANKA